MITDTKQEERDLLLKDLCARLSYGVKIKGVTTASGIETVGGYCNLVGYDFYVEEISGWFNIVEIKPYLRPLSSMTEEEKLDFNELQRYNVFYSTKGHYTEVDWLNAHHFDYRGLIENGLALEAPKDMYKF